MLYVHTNRAAEDMCNCTTLGNKEHSRETFQGISGGSVLRTILALVNQFSSILSSGSSSSIGQISRMTYTRKGKEYRLQSSVHIRRAVMTATTQTEDMRNALITGNVAGLSDPESSIQVEVH